MSGHWCLVTRQYYPTLCMVSSLSCGNIDFRSNPHLNATFIYKRYCSCSVELVKHFPMLKVYIIIYTVVDILCAIEYLIFSHLQLSFFTSYFLKHTYSSSDIKHSHHCALYVYVWLWYMKTVLPKRPLSSLICRHGQVFKMSIMFIILSYWLK